MDYINLAGKNKGFFKTQPKIVTRILDYKEKVLQGKIACNLPSCPQCTVSSDQFKRHELRKRQFNVIVDEVVLLVLGLLIRWKCPGCGKSMIQYPDFALPFKRYVLTDIVQYAEHYVEDEEMTYDLLLKQKAAGYERRQDDERQLSPSTIHRWITTLGGFSRVIGKAQKLIHQKHPSISLTRYLAQLSVPARKYRSEKRRQTLVACRRLLHLERLFSRIFNVSLFSKVATSQAFT